MDKEYLSLMAELGEAPVPASVGSTSGPATTPLASAPRPAAPANNPPPPVSLGGWFLWPGSPPPFSSSETAGRCGQVLRVEQVDGRGWQHCSSARQGVWGLGPLPGGRSCPCVWPSWRSRKNSVATGGGSRGRWREMLSRSLSCPPLRAARPG